jgi:hypothetical protein
MNFGVVEPWEPATRSRAARFAMTFRLTREKFGKRRAFQFALRTIIVKLPQFVAHSRALRRRDKVRAEISGARLNRTNDHPHLALAVTGGIGDFIILARFARDLQASAGPFVFDVFAPEPKRAVWAFSAVPGFRVAYHDILFDRTIREYDLAVRANQMLIVYQETARWSVLREAPKLLEVVIRVVEARLGIDVFVQNHPWLDNHFARSVVFEGHRRGDYLQHFAGISHGGDKFIVPTDHGTPKRLGLEGRAYVTVHNGFDTGFVVSGRRATKCYPYFGAVIAQLKLKFSDVVFVQIGTKTSERIAECDLNLVNKTTMDEVAGLIAGAKLHLDNESGLVHLASCLGTRSAVVFGPTPSDFFGYRGNINIDPPICGNCWWMTKTWMDMCAKEYDTPRCMTEQDPAVVASRVAGALEEVVATWRNPDNLIAYQEAVSL